MEPGEIVCKLDKLVEIQKTISRGYPGFGKLYPVVLGLGERMAVFIPGAESYTFAGEFPAPMPIPAGIRASLTLPLPKETPVCLVTEEIFDEADGYVTLFHEFVHCRQFETCEMALKKELKIWQAATARQDFMWEIDHPFPYTDSTFHRLYTANLEALETPGAPCLADIRQELRRCLAEMDYEYLSWQEWKEGLARWLENRLRADFSLPHNDHGRAAPYHRITFYAGGERLVKHLVHLNPELLNDLPALYHAIFTPGE